MRLLYAIGWAWIIMVGGLMITPGGVFCTVCGRFNFAIGLTSILVGAVGMVATLRAAPRVAPG